MFKLNEFYSPDYKQAREHHQELLKQADQKRLALRAMATPDRKFAFSHGWEWLRYRFSVRRSRKLAQAASRSSGSRT